MIESETKSHDRELINTFSGHRSVQKANLRSFYFQRSQPATEQAFRRFLYGLEKRQIVTPIGAGIYAFLYESSQPASKKKHFLPDWSQEFIALNQAIQEAFPYIQYLGWETRVLHEFMLHQPGQNLFIIETEKDVCESAFNLLSQKYPGRTFFDPDRVMMKRYVLHQPDSILISRLITQAPKRTAQGISFPKLEKILVDIFVDEEKYFFFQGDELVHIFENAFASYWISERTLFRYGGRRKASKRLRQFINTQTQVKLSLTMENAE
ncbi:MAG TPA: DUF6577 family protein [Anaerolineales bacterium]|nr:DUF6577 family protein [Anaerolineales bacterium]